MLAIGFLSPPFLFFYFLSSSFLSFGYCLQVTIHWYCSRYCSHVKKKKLYFYLFLFFLTINPTFSLLNPNSPSKMIQTSKSTNHLKSKPTTKKKLSNLSHVTWLLKPNLDTKILLSGSVT